MSDQADHQDPLAAGRRLLARPLLPLVRLVQLLYLTGPFVRIEELLDQLYEPLSTGGVDYRKPGEALAGHRESLRRFEVLKDPAAAKAPATPANPDIPAGFAVSPSPTVLPALPVLDGDDQPLPFLEALEAQVCQAVLTAELEAINSLLCGPCGCSLCCTGPEDAMRQLFFEIPLVPEELHHLAAPLVDSAVSRAATSDTEPALEHAGGPFYEQAPAIYHWRTGWSLILPRNQRCPQLAAEGGCRIYPQRPAVCRRPQIFAYLLDVEEKPGTTASAVYRRTNKLLAVWDCPYVQKLRDEIIDFARLSGLEPVFRTNKA